MLDDDIDLKAALSRAKRTLRDAAWVGRMETLPADLMRLRRRYLEFADFEPPS